MHSIDLSRKREHPIYTLYTLQLEEIQSRLLDVGSAVATPADSSSQAKLARVAFPSSATAQVEVREQQQQHHHQEAVTCTAILAAECT
jgi:hypothetical protein